MSFLFIFFLFYWWQWYQVPFIESWMCLANLKHCAGRQSTDTHSVCWMEQAWLSVVFSILISTFQKAERYFSVVNPVKGNPYLLTASAIKWCLYLYFRPPLDKGDLVLVWGLMHSDQSVLQEPEFSNVRAHSDQETLQAFRHYWFRNWWNQKRNKFSRRGTDPFTAAAL